MYRPIFASVIGVAFASKAFAQDHQHHPPGEKLGTVHFQTSCSPAVAPAFDRATAWLHSFEFGEAIKGYQAVLAADSTCAMAHWGIALSRWGNPMAVGNRGPAQLAAGRAAAAAGRALAGAHITEREKSYIAAVGALYRDFETTSQPARVAAYAESMTAAASAHAEDTEAQIFYAISLVAAASPTDKTYASQRKAGAILEALWAKQPDHPGLAHYIIHTYDYPALAAQASRAARGYAAIAPSAAHAQHMPSHTFTRTGLWRESIETNLRSREIALSTGSIAEALHALDYAAYAYLQLRRNADAKGVVDQLPGLAKRFDVNAVTGAAPGSAGVFALAAIPARYALEREAWAEAAALTPNPSGFPWTEAMTYFARGIGASRTKNLSTARAAVDSLSAIRERLVARNEVYWSEQVGIQHLIAQAWLDHSEGRVDSALARMRRAASREDATEKNAVTPGPLAPARELLGDMLMLVNKPAEALAEYRATLAKEPNRYRALAGGVRAARAAGDNTAQAELQVKLDALKQSG